MRNPYIRVMAACLAIQVAIAAPVVPKRVLASDGAAKIEATTTEITAADLASALNLQWWSYRLRFDKPVEGVWVRPCELSRQPNGTWEKKYLAIGYADYTRHVRDINVALFIPDTPKGDKYALKLGRIFVRSEFQAPPDLKGMYTSPDPAQMIAGCLILACQEKDPSVATGREENMVRLFGLDIETDEGGRKEAQQR